MNNKLHLNFDSGLTRATAPATDAEGATQPSARVVEVAAMFGLGLDQTRAARIIPPTELSLGPGEIIFVTGASGGGKSTLLRLIAERLESEPGVSVQDFNAPLTASSDPIIDAVDRGRLPLKAAMQILSLAGLNDTFVMLRSPRELSDGQRYRFRLARIMARIEAERLGRVVILADEFGATLDRVTASAVSRNLRRWVSRTPGVTLIAATTHDDLLEPLQPDVLIEKRLGEQMTVLRRG